MSENEFVSLGRPMKGAFIYDLDSTPVETKPWTELENVRKYFDFFDSYRNEFLTE